MISSGCAYHQDIIRTPDISLYNQTIMFHNTRYVPLLNFCDYYRLDCNWDLVSQRIELKKDSKSVVLRPDSSYALVDGRAMTLDYPVEYKSGAAYIPTKTAVYIAEKVFGLKKVPGLVPKTYEIRTVVIDPGHGGKDPGARGKYGTREKDVVLDVARKMKKDLEKSGLKVYLTRSSDVFIPLDKRTAFANSKKADLFISVHANASRYSRAKGFEVYYLSEATDDNARALAAAENASLKFENISTPTEWDLKLSENRRVSKELSYYICNITSNKLSMKKRGVKGARFVVLKGALMPAVLVEIGFLSNKREESNLKSSAFRSKIADAISGSVLSYKKEYESKNGFTR